MTAMPSAGNPVSDKTESGNVVHPAAFESVERRTRLVLARLPLLAVLLSPDGTVLECNFGSLGEYSSDDPDSSDRPENNAADAARQNPADWLGNAFEDGPWWSYSDGSRLAARSIFQRALGGERISEERLYKRADGRMGVMSLTLSPLQRFDGSLDRILVTALDVTHRTGGKQGDEALRADMAYRMRNSFSVMDALAARAEPGDAASLSSRLDCVRQAHQLCAHYLFFDVPVEDIVRTAIPDCTTLELALDAVSAPARDVEVLLLVLTALARPERKATLNVRGVDGNALQVVWSEGAPRPADAMPDALSAAILDDIVTLQTGGTVSQSNGADGFRWSLLLPLDRNRSAA